MANYIEVRTDNPERKKILDIVEAIRKGAIVIYPTDSVYAMGCDPNNTKTADKMSKIKGVARKEAKFSLICRDISQISEYTSSFDRGTFKVLNKNLPGAFTFVMDASKKVKDTLKYKRSQIGVRVPDSNILNAITEELGHPLLSTSIHSDDEILEYFVEPKNIEEKYGNDVDIIIDGGLGAREASTVVDCTNGEMQVVRQGKAELQL